VASHQHPFFIELDKKIHQLEHLHVYWFSSDDMLLAEMTCAQTPVTIDNSDAKFGLSFGFIFLGGSKSAPQKKSQV
jgi:hypothetical protein